MKQRYMCSLLFFAFLMTGFNFAIAQPTQWSKLYSYPEGGNIKDITSDNTGRIFVLAGFLSNIYYSEDNGQSWTPLPGTDGFWNTLDIEVDKSNGTLYVGTTGNGIFWTPNLGTDWYQEYITTDPVSGFHATFLSVAAKHDGNTVIGSDNKIFNTPIYTTINGGTTWTIQPLAPFSGATDLEFLPNGDVLAGTEKGVYKSTTLGASWTPLNTGMSTMHTRSIALKQSNGYLFAATDIDATTGDTTTSGVYVSTNNGASWTNMSAGITNHKVRAVHVDAVTGNVYAGTQGGMFMSTDNGATWTGVNINLRSRAITGIARNNSGIFSISEKSGVAHSANPASGWTYKNHGISVTTIRDMTMDAAGSIYLLDEEVSGVYKRAPAAANWEQAAPQQLPTFFGRKIIYAGDTLYTTFSTQNGFPKSGVFMSTDHGVSWTDISATIPIPSNVPWVSFEDIEAYNGALYVYVNNEIFRSLNVGASWTSIRQGSLRGDIDVAPDGTLYCTTLDFSLQIIYEFSTDQGTTFNPISTGTMFLSEFADLLVDKTGALYIKDDGKIYKRNASNNWQLQPNGGWDVNSPYRADMGVYFDNVNSMYVTFPQEGIFYSPNGITWSNASAGIPFYNSSGGGTLPLELTDLTFDQNNIPYARSASAEAGNLQGIYWLTGSLPVNFLNIAVVKTGSGQLVSWKVAEELNVESYQVERSYDGHKFYTVSVVAVSGSNGIEKTYSWTDGQRFSAIVYYRIKALDADGSARYSTIAILKTGEMIMQITVYPNPVTKGLLNMRLENATAGDYHLSIIDNAGKKIYSDVLSNASGGTMVLSRYIPALLTAGTYTVIVKHDNQSFSKRILVAEF